MAAEVQPMHQYWKNFDLPELQRELDTSATDIANRQDESDKSRRRLVELSREFKKNTPEDIRKVVAPLLKSFQGEIDALSKRSKSAEAAFLSVYKKLIDTPDPASVLEYCLTIQKQLHRAQDLEIENKQLRETLNEYNSEFADVKNQEVTIKHLREKLKEYEEKQESNLQVKIREKEKELQRVFTDKERQLQEAQIVMATKLGEAEHKAATLQSALDNTQSELFELKSKFDEVSHAKSDEVEMIMTDLERANQRSAAAEREAGQLREQLLAANQNLQLADKIQKAPDMEQTIDILTRSSLEVELAAKEKEITQLVEEVQRLQGTITKLKDTTSSQIANLEEQLSSKTRMLEAVEEKLRGQEDYEEIKNELNVMKSIEFPGQVSGEHSTLRESGQTKSLETLLLEKNRALQSENTNLKLANSDLLGTLQRIPLAVPFPAAHPHLQNIDSFSSLLGQEIVSSYQFQQRFNHASPLNSPKLPAITNGCHSMKTANEQHSPKENSNSSSIDSKSTTNVQLHFDSVVSSDVLNTSEVAQRVRELLSVHNIGQRLFAKTVLGLSQGTVSELLSKPKSWDKLTEKGRESYRKMHSWACSEENINLLKSLTPRKAKEMSPPNSQHSDSQTEERIAQILNEAQQQMQVRTHLQKSKELNSMNSAMVSSIYHQELAKLMHNQQQHHHHHQQQPQQQHHEHHASHGRRRHVPSAEDLSMTQEMVSRIYHEELAKLGQAYTSAQVYHSTNTSQCQPASVKEEPADSTDSLSTKSNELVPVTSDDGALRHAGSAFSLVRPRSSDPKTSQSDISPLQRMQSIANSLMQQQMALPPNRPLKAVLPPITQEQFDKFSVLNTEVIVKHIKEQLSQFSISQRLFGETVLGLSQGSVSDLLARPKPWHMLTQKGREPFIRMQMFLEEADSIPRLLSSQYKIQPDKFMRTSQMNSSPFPPVKMPKIKKEPQPPALSPPVSSAQNHIVENHMPPSPPRAVLPPPPTSEPAVVTSSSNTSQSSVFEMAALTTDLDTLAITGRVKDVLVSNNIGQKLFGEAVLGLSQGSVSELLSKPKPWHMLSLKGREPFIRMHMWLEDPSGVEKMMSFKTHQRGHKKRKSLYDFETPTLSDIADLSMPTKKSRILFTDEQKESLKAAYAQDPYPNTQSIEALGQQLGLSTRTVVNWFHNHRMRLKQQFPLRPANADGLRSHADSSDELSNLSSGDYPVDYSLSGSESQAGGDSNQWLFPSFERIDVKQSKEENDGKGKPESVTPTSESNGGLGANAPPPETKTVNKRKKHTPKWIQPSSSICSERVLSPNVDGHAHCNGSPTFVEDKQDKDSELRAIEQDYVKTEELSRKGVQESDAHFNSMHKSPPSSVMENGWDADEDNRTSNLINGVCVVQTQSLFANGDSMNDTSAGWSPKKGSDELWSQMTMHKGGGVSIENEHLQHIERLNRSITERVEGKSSPVPSVENSENRSVSACSQSIQIEPDSRLANIERLQRSLEEQHEDWDDPVTKKQEQEHNIQKLKQNIEGDVDEEWEF